MKDSTAIVIALIGIVVPATGAYLAFYDRRHPVNEPPPIPNSGKEVAPLTDQRRGQATDAATDDPASSDDEGEKPIPETRGSQSAIRPIAGIWTGDDGYRFVFSQTGARFRYHATQGNIDQGSGNGTIKGSTLTYIFDAPGFTGACDATLSGNGNRMVGRCHASDMPAKTWPMAIDRLVR